MKMRIDYHDKFREEPLRAMLALEKYVHECGLDGKLLELVKMRASQINGCAYCLDMHSKGANAGRDRAAALCAERVARDDILQRTGARGVGMDGGRNAGFANACSGRSV